MHIAIAGPIATDDVAHLLDGSTTGLPAGYAGAPLLATLLGELLDRGHRVSAFTLSNDLPLRRAYTVAAKGDRLTLYFCPSRPRAWPPNGWRPGRIVDLYAFERAGLRQAIAQARPDVVHAHWAYEFAWAALRTGLPHVVTCHDSPMAIARSYRGLKLGGYRRLRSLMAWHVLRHARRVTAVSPYLVSEIQPMCRWPVSMIPNPVSPSAFALSHRHEPGRVRLLMACVGWSERKNPQPALRAFSVLSRRFPNAQMVAIGAGFGPGEQAECWCDRLSLSGSIHFRGSVPHREVLALMAQCDVLIHPSREESFGMVIAEAMAVGLPVVAGESSGAVPRVAGGVGRLVDVTRCEAIVDAVAALVADPLLRADLRDRGRRRASAHFNAQSVAHGYEAQYAAALRSQRPLP